MQEEVGHGFPQAERRGSAMSAQVLFCAAIVGLLVSLTAWAVCRLRHQPENFPMRLARWVAIATQVAVALAVLFEAEHRYSLTHPLREAVWVMTRIMTHS
jgi:type III secretory pathway component EscS